MSGSEKPHSPAMRPFGSGADCWRLITEVTKSARLPGELLVKTAPVSVRLAKREGLKVPKKQPTAAVYG